MRLLTTALALAAASLSSGRLAAQPYDFTRIAKDFEPFDKLGFIDADIRTALTADGTVVFGGFLPGNFIVPGRTDRLYAGSGGPVGTIDVLPAGYTNIRNVAVNASGALVFSALRTAGIDTFAGAYRTSTSAAPFATLYEGNTMVDPLQPPLTSDVALSTNGTVAFSSVLNGSGAIRRGPVAGAIEVLRAGSGTFFNNRRGIAVNDAGTVALEMEYTDPTRGLARGILLFTAPGQALAQISTAIEKASVALSSRLAMNASGQVAFAINSPATLRFYDPPDDAGGTLIATIELTPGAYLATPTPFGQPSIVQIIGGPVGYDAFGAVTIDAAGTVLFEASPVADPNWGVYRGPDPIADKIIQTGDLLDGRIVSLVMLGELNDAGQFSLLTSEFGGDRNIWRVGGVQPPPASPPLAIERVAPINRPAGIDRLGGAVLSTVNGPGGMPFNLERIEPGAGRAPFSSLMGRRGDLALATSGSPAGAVFTSNGSDGQIVRIADGGATVLDPWVALGAIGAITDLHVDGSGVFGGDLLVVTSLGRVWRVADDGRGAPLADLGRACAGVITLPDDPRYGPLAGKCVVGVEGQASLYAVAADGSVTAHAMPAPVHALAHIASGEALFGVDAGNGQLVRVPASELVPFAGDVLLAQQLPRPGEAGLFLLRWDGGALRATPFSPAARSAPVFRWGQLASGASGGGAPDCRDDAPAHASVGVPLRFTVVADDADPADIVTLSVSGLPAGANAHPPLPASGNPVASEIRWTPSPRQVGCQSLVFTAIDRDGRTAQCTVSIEVAHTLLLLGFHRLDLALGGDDHLYVAPLLAWPVSEQLAPGLPIPDLAILRGLRFFQQVVALDPVCSPHDPLRTSNGLAATIGAGAPRYGVASGIELEALTPPDLGGVFRVKLRFTGR